MTPVAIRPASHSAADFSGETSKRPQHWTLPTISLVLVGCPGTDRTETVAAFELAVRSLGSERGEVILVREMQRPNEEADLMRVVSEHGGVVVVAPEGADRMALSKLGVAAARGDVIAVRDASCVVRDAWVRDLLAAWGGTQPKIARAAEGPSTFAKGADNIGIAGLMPVDGTLERTLTAVGRVG